MYSLSYTKFWQETKLQLWILMLIWFWLLVFPRNLFGTQVEGDSKAEFMMLGLGDMASLLLFLERIMRKFVYFNIPNVLNVEINTSLR